MMRVFLTLLLIASRPLVSVAGPGGSATLVQADRLIDKGRILEAERLMASGAGRFITPAEGMRSIVLRARIHYERGGWAESVGILRHAIDSAWRARPDPEALAYAYLQYIDGCRSLLWLERMHRATDTVGLLIRRYGLPAPVRMRYHTNKALYFSIQVLNAKATPHVDTMDMLLSKAPAADWHLYRPVWATSVRVNYFRNKNYDSLISLVGRIWREYPSRPEDQVFDHVALWRAVANFHIDGIRRGDTDPSYVSKTMTSLDRAIGVLDDFYPRNDAERVMLLNLKGLMHVHRKEPIQAVAFFERSEAILARARLPMDMYTWSFACTGFWKMSCVNQAYRGEALRRERLRLLRFFTQLATCWDDWREINQIDSLRYYRNIYSTDPQHMLVSLFHELHRDSGDPRWLDSAFAAQEHSRYADLVRRMGKGAPPLQIPSLSRIRASLDPDEAIVSYSDAWSVDYKVYTLVISRDTTFLLRITDPELEDMTRSGIFQMGMNEMGLDAFVKAHHEAYRVLFKGVADRLGPGIRRILVYPSTRSSVVRLEMLIPDTVGARSFRQLRYLGSRYNFRYDLSWTVAELRKRMGPYSASRREDMVFVPGYAATPEFSLPFFEAQGKELRRRYGFRTFLGKDGSKDQFQRNADRARILHLGAHGYASTTYNGEQFVELDGTPGHGSGDLHAKQLFERDLHADLAVIAICEGGVSEERPEGMNNMPYWFLYAGARSCLFSRWKLDDRATSAILSRFYFHMSQGHRKSVALAMARRDYLASVKSEEELNPVYWGGLTILGDDAPIPLRQKNRLSWWWIPASLLLATVWWRRRELKAALTIVSRRAA